LRKIFIVSFFVFLAAFVWISLAILPRNGDGLYKIMWRNSLPAVVRVRPLQVCRVQLYRLQSALLSYAKAHQGKLPPAPKADDYYFWMEPVRKYLPSENNSDYFFCRDDDLRKDPSSYIMDPKLGGKKLSELGDLSQVVLLREREFRHFGKAFYADAKDQVGRFAPGALPSGMRFNPQLPPRENIRVIAILSSQRVWFLLWGIFGFLALIALSGWVFRFRL